MHWKRVTALFPACAVCALLFCGFPTLPASASAQTKASQDDQGSRSKRKKSADETAASPSQAATQPTDSAVKKHRAPTPTRNASDGEIQAAKASGKVWVNTETGVFHKGGRWYGATKQGKFMTEEEAAKAGYRSAKNEK
jgi:hypothetical protein